MIKVVDNICGSGKSTAIFKMIRDSPNKRYLYVTPLLSEVEDRLPDVVGDVVFESPVAKGGKKVNGFVELVEKGVNISTTHKLFGMLDSDVVDMVIEKEYCLIIDEVINCFGLLPDGYKPSDVEALLEGDFLSCDQENRGKLTWNEDKYPNHDGRYSFIRNMCNLNMLYQYNNMFLMWEYPPKLLEQLDDIYVVTYMFEGSDMRCWLDLCGIEYEYVDTSSMGMRSEEDIKKVIRDNLTILSNRTLSNMRQTKTTFSNRWFQMASKDKIDTIKGVMRSTLVQHGGKGDLFWTTFKSHSKRVAGDGFKKGIGVGMGKDNVFLPCTTRATNDYVDRKLCIYAMNMFKNPVELQYMRYNGVEPNEDVYALSEMVQFMFRGCIRKGEPMKILVLSNRMRGLLEEWLHG